MTGKEVGLSTITVKAGNTFIPNDDVRNFSYITVQNVKSITLDPSEKTIYFGDKFKLNVKIEYEGTPPPEPPPISWTIPAGGIISFDEPTLTVTGVALGQATLIATCEGKTSSSEITVAAFVSLIEVYPQEVILRLGESIQLTGKVMSKPMDAGLSITWETYPISQNVIYLNPSTGYVTSRSEGWVIVKASCFDIVRYVVVGVWKDHSNELTGFNGYWCNTTPYYGHVMASFYQSGINVTFKPTYGDTLSGQIIGNSVTFTYPGVPEGTVTQVFTLTSENRMLEQWVRIWYYEGKEQREGTGSVYERVFFTGLWRGTNYHFPEPEPIYIYLQQSDFSDFNYWILGGVAFSINYSYNYLKGWFSLGPQTIGFKTLGLPFIGKSTISDDIITGTFPDVSNLTRVKLQ